MLFGGKINNTLYSLWQVKLLENMLSLPASMPLPKLYHGKHTLLAIDFGLSLMTWFSYWNASGHDGVTVSTLKPKKPCVCLFYFLCLCYHHIRVLGRLQLSQRVKKCGPSQSFFRRENKWWCLGSCSLCKYIMGIIFYSLRNLWTVGETDSWCDHFYTSRLYSAQ